MEITIKKEALNIAARFLEKMLNTDTSDYAGSAVTCISCGKKARYVSHHSKTFTLILGNISLNRAYYYCQTCGHGWCPKDYALGFGDSSLSPGVTRMVSLVASAESFLEGSKLLSELAAINVSGKCVERTAKKIGSAIATDEIVHVEEKPNPRNTMYVGVDGTGIPIRPSELIDRPGKQPNGTAKTREVKECVVWTADSRDSKGNPVRDLGSVTYSAAIESCAWSNSYNKEDTPAFARRVERELTRTGFFLAQRQVFIGDGALWIWNLAGIIAPEAIQIVDLYHAKEHLSKLANVIFGSDTDLAKKWATDQHNNLESGNLDTVLSAIGCHMSRSAEVGEKASKEFDYFTNNRNRMKYDYFRSLGLCVGSGVVEAGCRVVIGQRLKRSGMFWSLNGANAIIALRSSLLSGRFDDFWARYRANNKSQQVISR
jgi:hypothetical protein